MFEDRNAKGYDAIIQCLAWCTMPAPKGQKADYFNSYIAIGTSAGLIKLVDLNRNKVLS